MESRESGQSPKSSSREAPHQKYSGLGRNLDWESPLENIAFSVELPFWLLMPATTLEVSVDGFTTEVIVENEGIEIQRGRQFSRTHRNTVFIGGVHAASKANAPILALPEGGLSRPTRTLIYVSSFANADALNAFFNEDGPRFQDAYRYFASLSLAHLPVLNALINAYRRASIDPFATEVTAWDVPIWFVCHPPNSQSVCLYSHLVEDWYPTIRDGIEGGTENPYIATDADAVKKQLNKKVIPGEAEMLDGWSLLHRGRYGDSIRSFVTAIEVLVESELRRMLADTGLNEEQIDNAIDTTRNNFDQRLLDYCRMSGRRVPGPILHYIPYINGVRLTDELDRTRKLRHRIVHHGHRLDHTFTKPMLRAAETTSWLFDWLSETADFEDRRAKNSTFFFGLRTNATPFESSVRDGRIIIEPPPHLEEDSKDTANVPVVSPDHVVYSRDMFVRTLNQYAEGGKDVEHFTKMAFFELGLGEVEDSPFVLSENVNEERFRAYFNGKNIVVFVLDTAEPVRRSHVEEVISALGNRKTDPLVIDHTVLVINDQMDLLWNERTIKPELDADTYAQSNGVSLIRTSELARLVLGAMEYGWSTERIIEELLAGGLQGTAPPTSTLVGNVYHFWERPQVVGIQPSGSTIVQSGDLIVLRLRDRFHQETVSEIKTDEEGRLTIKVCLHRSDVSVGAPVYLLDRDTSFGHPPYSEDSMSVIESMIGSSFIHPSRRD